MRGFMLSLALSTVVSFAATLTGEEKKEAKPKPKGEALSGKMLEKMDANGDGKVSKDEFKKFFQERLKDKDKGDKATEFMTRIFDKADTNADGYIDRDEFAKMMEQLGNGGNLKEKLKQKLKDKFNKNVPDPSE